MTVFIKFLPSEQQIPNVNLCIWAGFNDLGLIFANLIKTGFVFANL